MCTLLCPETGALATWLIHDGCSGFSLVSNEALEILRLPCAPDDESKMWSTMH